MSFCSLFIAFFEHSPFLIRNKKIKSLSFFFFHTKLFFILFNRSKFDKTFHHIKFNFPAFSRSVTFCNSRIWLLFWLNLVLYFNLQFKIKFTHFPIFSTFFILLQKDKIKNFFLSLFKYKAVF